MYSFTTNIAETFDTNTSVLRGVLVIDFDALIPWFLFNFDLTL